MTLLLYFMQNSIYDQLTKNDFHWPLDDKIVKVSMIHSAPYSFGKFLLFFYAIW